MLLLFVCTMSTKTMGDEKRPKMFREKNARDPTEDEVCTGSMVDDYKVEHCPLNSLDRCLCVRRSVVLAWTTRG